jgi:hypothetical protein
MFNALAIMLAPKANTAWNSANTELKSDRMIPRMDEKKLDTELVKLECPVVQDEDEDEKRPIVDSSIESLSVWVIEEMDNSELESIWTYIRVRSSNDDGCMTTALPLH